MKETISRDKQRATYQGAKDRFLKPCLSNFILKEFPSFGGSKTVEWFVEELLKMLERLAILKDKILPGQILWYALSKRTRITSKNPEFIPVVLTLVSPEDVELFCQNTKKREIKAGIIARMLREAYRQGGLLSMRDLSLIFGIDHSETSHLRKLYEEKHKIILPHQGSEHDFGTTSSHKSIVIRKVILEGKDPARVAKEINHSQRAVDIYLQDYYRVKHCFERKFPLEEIVLITQMSKTLVKEYISIIKEHERLKS